MELSSLRPVQFWPSARHFLARFFGPARGVEKPRLRCWFRLLARAGFVLARRMCWCVLGLGSIFTLRVLNTEFVLDGQKGSKEMLEADFVHGTDGEGNLKDLLKVVLRRRLPLIRSRPLRGPGRLFAIGLGNDLPVTPPELRPVVTLKRFQEPPRVHPHDYHEQR